MKIYTYIISAFVLIIIHSCCASGDNVTSTRLLDSDTNFLPYSEVFATEFQYYYSKPDDTLSLVFNRPTRAIDDQRNGAESCNVQEFEIYETTAFRSGLQINFSMQSGPFSSSLVYTVRDPDNGIDQQYSFEECSFEIEGLNFSNCLEDFTLVDERFEDVIVLSGVSAIDGETILLAILNSESGLVYADLNGDDFIRIVQ